MIAKSLQRMLVLTACASTLVSCGQSQVSQLKEDVDKQKGLQKELVDRRTSELKEGVDLQVDQSLRALDAEKKQLDMEKVAVEGKKEDWRRHEDFTKKNLDKQAAASKKEIDRNADLLKAKIDARAKAKG